MPTKPTRPVIEYTLRRNHGTEVYTGGILYRGTEIICYTLEDQERPVKINGVTAIPTGRYKLIINKSVRFKKLMPLLLNVPFFTGIRFHAGRAAGKETLIRKVLIDKSKPLLKTLENIYVSND
jgi:hypothetical protein